MRAGSAALRALQAAAAHFDPQGMAAKRAALERTAAEPLVAGAGLARYYEALLFLAAHPSDAAMRAAIEREFGRIARFVKGLAAPLRERLVNEGLPWADTVTRFTHDQVRWLLQQRGLRTTLDHVGEPKLTLNEVLRLTLPAPEWAETTAGYSDEELLAALRVPVRDRLAFTVQQLARLDHEPFTKDHLFDALDLFVRVSPRTAAFAKHANRIPLRDSLCEPFWQRERLKRFDARALMDQALPAARVLDAAARERLAGVIRNTLTLTARETDPGTYMEIQALRLWDLERGLSVALYPMVPARQLAFESYVGHMLFKNGYPVSYGGAWVLGERAEFGMNIFEPYRGGESGYAMCQLLRTYRQAFGVRYFEVDAYQFGRDNPEGIASGAFWFYYRHGFRPVDAALADSARREQARLAATPLARTSERMLLAFAGSNVALNFGGPVPAALATYTARITRWMARRWHGDRAAAIAAAVRDFEQLAGAMGALPPGGQRALEEMALWAAAMGWRDPARIALLERLVRLKPLDPYAYQRTMLELLTYDSPARRRTASP